MLHPFAKIESNGSYVSNVELRKGIEQRPLFATLERLSPDLAIKWSDRLNSTESIACEWALAMCFEKAMSVKVPQRALYLRMLAAEIQRLIWLYTYLTSIFRAIGDTIRAQQALRLREFLLSAQEIFTGSRVLPQVLCVGGIERDLSLGEIRKIRETILGSSREMSRFFSGLGSDVLLQRRLTDVAPVRADLCATLRWGGIVGRASGFDFDVRKLKPYGCYLHFALPATPPPHRDTSNHAFSDGLGRLKTAVAAIGATVDLALAILERLPDGPSFEEVKFSDPAISADTGWSAMVEAGSGCLYATVTDSSIRIRTTSMRVAPAINEILRGIHIEDLEIGLASLGFDATEADLR